MTYAMATSVPPLESILGTDTSGWIAHTADPNALSQDMLDISEVDFCWG
jgi:hypothetical protein